MPLTSWQKGVRYLFHLICILWTLNILATSDFSLNFQFLEGRRRLLIFWSQPARLLWKARTSIVGWCCCCWAHLHDFLILIICICCCCWVFFLISWYWPFSVVDLGFLLIAAAPTLLLYNWGTQELPAGKKNWKDRMFCNEAKVWLVRKEKCSVWFWKRCW